MVNNCNKNIFKNVVFADIAGFLSDSCRASGRFQSEQYYAGLKELGRPVYFFARDGLMQSNSCAEIKHDIELNWILVASRGDNFDQSNAYLAEFFARPAAADVGPKKVEQKLF